MAQTDVMASRFSKAGVDLTPTLASQWITRIYTCDEDEFAGV
jgi:hypothetical protein